MEYKPWDYNLTLQFFKRIGTDNNRYKNIKWWLQCKLSKLKFDCDVSKYAMWFYKYKYDFLNSGYVEPQYTHLYNYARNYNSDYLKWELDLNENRNGKEIDFKKIFSGDTLNSFATPFISFVNEFIDKACICKVPKINLYDWLLKDFDIIFSNENLYKIEYSKEILDAFERFAGLTYTIGNLFPVPLHFNACRSGNDGKYEFPDILLSDIYNYYTEKESLEIDNQPMLKCISNQKKIEFITYWLDSFGGGYGGWINYVSKYCFGMYLKADGTPEKLWDKHSVENTKLPKIGEEFLDYINFINRCIEVRGRVLLQK